MHAAHQLAVFALAPSSTLVDAVCTALETGTPARMELRTFEDGEHKIRPLESVRGRDVFVVGSFCGDTSGSVNDQLVRALFFTAALRDAGARRLTLVAPYLCYMRKDRRTKARDPVTSRYVATLFESMRLDRVVTVDVHNPAAYENAFRIPADHLTAAHLFVQHLQAELEGQAVCVVSPDAGGVKRAERFRRLLEVAVRSPVSHAFVEKYRSEGEVRGGLVAGDVRGRTVVLVDDLVSSGTTLARAARACRDAGAESVLAVATHAVFSADAAVSLAGDELDRLCVTNSVRPQTPGILGSRLEVLDLSPLVAAAIRRLHEDASLLDLTDLMVPHPQ